MSEWSPQEDAIIRANPSMSAAALTRLLKGRTRAAIIGRWHRLGYNKQTGWKRSPRGNRPQIGKPIAAPRENARSWNGNGPRLQPLPIWTEPTSPVPLDKRHQVEALAADQCKWIYGDVKRDPLWHYCDQQAEHGPYCATHRAATRVTRDADK
jgi:hypothetical protein